MCALIIAIYTKLYFKNRPKWEKEIETKKWHKWEQYEDIQEDMGVTSNTIKVPKRRKKKISPRKKHAV